MSCPRPDPSTALGMTKGASCGDARPAGPQTTACTLFFVPFVIFVVKRIWIPAFAGMTESWWVLSPTPGESVSVCSVFSVVKETGLFAEFL
jgi:hypothetical protein